MGLLDGRVCVLTGAGRGIGASLARIMAAEGAAVVVNDTGDAVDGAQTSERPAEQIANAIVAAGGRAVPNYDSVSNHDAAENIIRTALNEFGQLDVLVNVAGILRDRMIFNMNEADWDAVIDVHLTGTFNTAKFAAIHWRAERKGHYRLINFTSESGLNGAPGQPNYAAAKLGIVGLTRSCANALGRYGVTANCISPRASTRMTDTVPEERRNDGADDMRSASNVAPPVVWLATPETDWFTGQVIGVHDWEIALYNEYRMISRIISDKPWTVERAFDQIENAFHAALEGTEPSVRQSLGRG